MIFVHDKGRMCNNILQFGHVYAWAREHNRSVVSMRFAYKYKYFHISDTPRHNIFFYLMGKYGAKMHLLPVVEFDADVPDTSMKEVKMIDHRHIVVEGWYVRFYDLFLKYRHEIKALFAFKPDIVRKTTGYLAPYGQSIKLGLHVRRGDYATWQDGKYLFSDAQFISIVNQFATLHTDLPIELFVCGNDPSLDKQAYINAFGAAHVHFPDGNPGEDLCLLSQMDYLIGPPSTFTLVASMYRDVPLYWIQDAGRTLQDISFKKFDELFRRII